MESMDQWADLAGEGFDLNAGPRWAWSQVQIVQGGDWGEAPAFWSRRGVGGAWAEEPAAAAFSSGEEEAGFCYGRELAARIIGIRECFAAEGEGDAPGQLFARWAEGRRGRLQLALTPWDWTGADDAIVVLSVSGVRAQRLRAATVDLQRWVQDAGAPLFAARVTVKLGAEEAIGKGRNRYTLIPIVVDWTSGSMGLTVDLAAAIMGWRRGIGADWRAEWAGLPR